MRRCRVCRVDVLSEVTFVRRRWTFDILVYRLQMKVDCWLFEQRVIGHLSFEKREYVKLSRGMYSSPRFWADEIHPPEKEKET